MKKYSIFQLLFILSLFGSVSLFASGGQEEPEVEAITLPEPPEEKNDGSVQAAVLAGGCFWGVEAVFESLEGVQNVLSGYAGGAADEAHYNLVGTGLTDHAESVYIEYDSSKIDYGTLLKVFFSVAHDPTQLNYQGPDHGPQYRSAIFYTNEDQKRIAEEYIAELESAGIYNDEIVTKIDPLPEFYPAEEYHQDFMRLNPDHPYIQYWDAPKIRHLEAAFPELLKSDDM